LTDVEQRKADEKSNLGEPVLIETRTLEDVKCGNCGVPLLIHVFLKGEKYERIVECKECGVSFPLEGDHRPLEDKNNSTGKNGENKKGESMVERLVKSW